MTFLASPPAARQSRRRWVDARVVVGVLLVLVSVAVGARVVAGAGRTAGMLAATRALAAGTVLGPADLRTIQVRLGPAGAGYLPSGAQVAGRRLTQPVAAGSLLPRAALAGPGPAPVRLVTLPVAPGHLPAGLGQGDVVDVWSTPRAASGVPATPQLVLRSVVVQGVDGAGSGLVGSTSVGLMVAVPVGQVTAAVAAAEQGAVDVAEVPAP